MGSQAMWWFWYAASVWCSGVGAWPNAGRGRAGALGKLRTVFKVPETDFGLTWTTLAREGRRRVRPAPTFMEALYDAVASDPRVPLRGHVVRSYGEKAGNLTSTESITFDISGLESTEVMIEAELHLYRTETPAPLWNIVDYSNDSTLYYLVRVYQRLSAAPSFPLDSHRLLGVQHVVPIASPTGWHVINVRAAVADWLTRRRPNLGFLVHVASSAGHTAGDRVRFARRGSPGKEPALVIFTRRDDQGQVARQSAGAGVIRRRWRSVVDGVTNGARLVEWHRASPEAPVESPTVTEDGACRLKDLWVDIQEVGLAKWIAAPRGFNCGQCVGKCGFRLVNSDGGPTTTNHAALLGVLRRLGQPRMAPRPACTPTGLLPLTTLTCHPEGDYCTLRVLEDMVAEGCGCH